MAAEGVAPPRNAREFLAWSRARARDPTVTKEELTGMVESLLTLLEVGLDVGAARKTLDGMAYR